jgi:hypothetical protein
MLNKLFNQWADDWKNHPHLFWLELIGTVSSIAASVIISVWAGTIDLVWVFVCWMIGSLSLTVTAYMRSTAWPMLLMIVYTFFNTIGLYNTL